MNETHEASSLVQGEAHEDAEVIWGWVTDESCTVIATGFEESSRILQPQAVERRVNERVVRHIGGSRRGRARELHSGNDPIYEDYDIPTFFRTED